MKRLKFGNAILCDYATPSEKGKHTLVNVYSADIILTGTPSQLSMGLYLEHIQEASGRLEITLTFQFAGESIAVVKVNTVDMTKGNVGVIVIPSMPILFNKAGTLKLIASAEGYASQTIISKKVAVALTENPTV